MKDRRTCCHRDNGEGVVLCEENENTEVKNSETFEVTVWTIKEQFIGFNKLIPRGILGHDRHQGLVRGRFSVIEQYSHTCKPYFCYVLGRFSFCWSIKAWVGGGGRDECSWGKEGEKRG